MRGDARVFIHLNNTAVGAYALRAINSYASDAVVDSPPVVELRRRAREGVEEGLERLRRVWQRNVAGWWLVNSSGLAEAASAVP